jgi:hypothetical protein
MHLILMCSDASHQVAFIETLKRIILRVWRPAGNTYSMSPPPAKSTIRRRFCVECIGCFSIARAGAGISTDHPEADA